MSPRLVLIELSWKNKVARSIWHLVWLVLFRPTPVLAHGWRRFLLRLFGARISSSAVIYPSARIWAPWNLEMGDGSCLSHFVDCYCVAGIRLGPLATVSQYSYLCAASHDYSSGEMPMPLVAGPISIGARAWVAAAAFVGPGVSIGEGVIVGAASAVFRDIDDWTVVGGNPARFIKNRSPIGRKAAEGPNR